MFPVMCKSPRTVKTAAELNKLAKFPRNTSRDRTKRRFDDTPHYHDVINDKLNNRQSVKDVVTLIAIMYLTGVIAAFVVGAVEYCADQLYATPIQIQEAKHIAGIPLDQNLSDEQVTKLVNTRVTVLKLDAQEAALISFIFTVSVGIIWVAINATK